MRGKLKRLDQLLVERGLAESREKAKELILSGKVIVQGLGLPKPSSRVSENAQITLKEEFLFVSRGGYKLWYFLEELKPELEVKGKVCLDIGASTGGFTHCLLRRGAERVYALDVSRNQLHQKLREDERVVPIEGINARHLTPELFKKLIPEKVDIITIDVSFISLRLILKPLKEILEALNIKPLIIALIKPQFELSPSEVKGGVVRDPNLIVKAVEGVLQFAIQLGFRAQRVSLSKVKGTKGNQEVFSLLSLEGENIHLDPLLEQLRDELMNKGFGEEQVL